MNYQVFDQRTVSELDVEELEIARRFTVWNSKFDSPRTINLREKLKLIWHRLLIHLILYYKEKLKKYTIIRNSVETVWTLLFQDKSILGAPKLNSLRREVLISKDLGFAIPCSPTPKVSIIIPIHNEWLMTEKCLRSLQKNSDTTPYEVIIVDDNSSDYSREFLKVVRGVTIVRMEENVGYLRATNTGAKISRGNYLILLNNDTEPLSGWLDSLVKVLDRDRSIAICGSTLIYPNGILQESGGQVFSNGNAWNLGKGQSPISGEFQLLREVDYCSAASFIVRKDFWDNSNGFDDTYAPAYYEDTDLCLRAWKAGNRVCVDPNSWVVHHEGASHGTAIALGVKKYQEINRRKFEEKWNFELQNHWEDVGIARLELSRNSKGIIVLIDEQLPSPTRDSGSIRTIRLAKILIEIGYHVVLSGVHANIPEGHLSFLRNQGLEVHASLEDLFESLKTRSSRIKFFWLIRAKVIKNLMVHCQTLAPKATIISDLLDLRYSYPDNNVVTVNNEDLEISNNSDLVVLVSKKEAGILASSSRNSRIFDLWKPFEISNTEIEDFEVRRGVVFVGGFRHLPNIEGIAWFTKFVKPELDLLEFDEPIFVVGSGLPVEEAHLLEENGIKFLGYQENLESLYSRVKIAVVPLLTGHGLKGKLAEALSFGVPVVTTSIGADGFPEISSSGVEIEDLPFGFASKIKQIAENKAVWKLKSDLAFNYVNEFYSTTKIKSKVDILLNQAKKS